MCGIAGYIHYDTSRYTSKENLKRMTDALVHRGPDGEGLYTNQNIALGHRRLSIIDLESGHQPMKSLDDQLIITFNGEIYNYIELRAELQRHGHKFLTKSDTEVILAAYKQWGTECVHKFNGMWAFALWDNVKHELFCSRDRLGEKPFFYTSYDNTFVFGSEIKALFAYGVPRVVNPETLDAYLCFTYIPAPYTYFNGIHKLEPGHNLIVRKNGLSITEYWDLPINSIENHRKDYSNIHEEFRYLFDSSVQLRMRSDVSFGAFLSGGLDSASVVNAMSKNSNHPIQTFTIGFDNPDYDESHLAQLIAEQFGTTHSVNVVTPEDAENLLSLLAYHYDEPFGDSSALPTYIVSKIARKNVTMVLTGDGGDEVLSGYTIHQGEKFSHHFNKVPKLVREYAIKGTLRLFHAIAPNAIASKLFRVNKVLESSTMSFVGRLLSKQSGFSENERQLLLEETSYVRPAIEFVEERLKRVAHLDTFSQLNYWLSKVSLPDDMLTKVDRATMANSLEARVPFLDYRLVELMATVSMDVKLKGYTRKHVLRKTLGRELPVQLLKSKKKGFVVPLRDWMTAGSSDVLEKRSKYVADTGLINRKSLAVITETNKLNQNINANSWWTLAMLSGNT